MAFRERWLENVRGVATVLLSLRRLGTSPVEVKGNGLGWLRSREEEWTRKRLDEDARLRLELQNIRVALLNRTTQAR